MTQLVLDFDAPSTARAPRREHPTMSGMVAIGLRSAVGYWCAREWAAGRPMPCKLTPAQHDYVVNVICGGGAR